MAHAAALPKGVYIIASVEFWERFSYYGFLSILVFFLTAAPENGGFGWADAHALAAIGWLLGIIWFAPIAGGWFADRIGGAAPAVSAGTLLLGLGNLLLGVSAMLPPAASAELQRSGVPSQVVGLFLGGTDTILSSCFVLGLTLICLGAGLFKSNASSLLSQLFASDDPRREAGFAYFYMGINIGAIAAPLAIGWVGQQLGWHWGFLLAATGMSLGWVTVRFLLYPRLPSSAFRGAQATIPVREAVRSDAFVLILKLMPFASLYMAGLMMYSGLLNLYAERSVDRIVLGFEVPTTWCLSLNPFFILLLGPVISRFWSRKGEGGAQGLLWLKVSFGLLFAGAAFTTLVLAELAADSSPVRLWVIIAFYMLITVGELCIMPAGLAEIGATAPAGTVGMLMGLWLLTLGIGGVVAGQAGALAQSIGAFSVFAAMATALLACGGMLLLPYWRSRRGAFAQPSGAAPR